MMSKSSFGGLKFVTFGFDSTLYIVVCGDLKYLSWFGDGMKPKFGSNLIFKA